MADQFMCAHGDGPCSSGGQEQSWRRNGAVHRIAPPDRVEGES